MKLSEIKDENAIELLADILEPAADIFSDKDIVNIIRNGGNKMLGIKLALKNHKKAIIEILAALEGVPVNEYHCNVLTLPVKLLEIVNDEDLASFFTLQQQMIVEEFSGSVTENTTEKEK